MPKRISVTQLNASTIDIINTIRANASADYQNLVPEVTSANEIPAVGDVICGYPAFANQFVNSLVNRIALVRINSKTFNNPYVDLKKGFLSTGETVEEVYVNITKAREFSVEKADAREHKRTLPDVRTAFHAMNWKVQYPITIQSEDLRMAFTSMDGVQNLISKIIEAVYTAADYDEYLLFKYLIIKGVSSGKFHYVTIDPTDISENAEKFRGVSNDMTFLGTKYNAAGVHTHTPKADQYIFMDSFYNAKFDVQVLSSAFNMEKADFMGKLKLINDFTTFDNDRFSVIMEGSDMIEPVTDEELAAMQFVKACVVDKEWFQIYDNLALMSESNTASGLYWNYFYNVWKTVSSSPFANAVVFMSIAPEFDPNIPDELTTTVQSISKGDNYTILTLSVDEVLINHPASYGFEQNEYCTENGIAVHKYGVYIIPNSIESIDAGNLTIKVGGRVLELTDAIDMTDIAVGDEFAFGTL